MGTEKIVEDAEGEQKKTLVEGGYLLTPTPRHFRSGPATRTMGNENPVLESYLLTPPLYDVSRVLLERSLAEC
jgi:hypothetical protein